MAFSALQIARFACGPSREGASSGPVLTGRLLQVCLALLVAFLIAVRTLPCAAQERGYLGVDLQDLNAERARQLAQALGRDGTPAVLVVKPRPGSPAEQAGLRANDIILGIDGRPMERMAAAVDYIGSKPPGTRLKIQIWRDGQRRETVATLIKFPEASTLLSRIQTLNDQRRYTEVIPLAERLVEATRLDPGPQSIEHAAALDRLADALYSDGKYREAEPLNRQALAIRQQALGPGHDDVGWAHLRLGNTLDMLGRYDDSIAQYRSMVSVMEEAHGIEHDDVGLGLGNVANSLRKAGRHAEAVETFKQALAVREQALGPVNPKLVWTLERLRDELFAIGKPEEARIFSERATALWDKTLPPPSSEPFPRIEAGMHGAPIRRISVDSACRLMVTGSIDKTARLWALPPPVKEGEKAGEPKLIRVLRSPIGNGNDGQVRSVALSRDGQIVAAGGWNRNSDHRVHIFEGATGKFIRRLGKVPSPVENLVFSHDGKYLAATLHDGEGLRVWETQTWTLVAQDRDYSDKVSYGAAFDGAGRLYTVAYDGFLRRYGPDFKLELKVKTHGGENPYTVAVHPKNGMVAVGFEFSAAVEIYGGPDLKLLFKADTAGARYPYDTFYALAWSADGERLYGGGRYNRGNSNPVRIWERQGRGEGRNIPLARNSIMGVMPCGDSIAVGAQDPAFGLISLTGEKRFWQDVNSPDMRGKRGEDFTVSQDGTKVRFGLGENGVNPVLFDLSTGRITDQPTPVNGFAKPDVESLKLSDWRNNNNPKLDGKPIEIERWEESRSVAVAPGGERFVLGAGWSLRAYDKTGKPLWKRTVPDTAWGVNIAPDGKMVIAAYGDGSLRWHRLSDGEEVLALFVQPDTREWVLWTPQGYYASSVAGDQLIGWQLNKGWDQAGDFVTAAQLKKHLYRPDIVKRAYELTDAGQAVREAGLSGFKIAELATRTPPEFHIRDPGNKARADRSPLTVRLEVAPNNEPVTGFDIKVNGRQVTPRAVRDLPDATNAQSRTLNIPLERGENRIQVVARNAVGESVEEVLVYLDKEGLLDRRGKLFILGIGVDKYAKLDPQNALQYAAADARMIVETLARKAGALHTAVEAKLLITGGETAPTKANIEDALLMFRDAKPEDTVILFLAGHGVNDGADYLFMPEDAQVASDGKHWRPSSVVRWHVLQQALQEAQGNRIMFVDTCHSRGAYNPRLIKDAADANIVVLSATDTATEAQEVQNLGHGAFTYALDKGLNGGADFAKRGAVSIFALSEFVSDEVKRLTNDEQEPTFSASGVKNFVMSMP